jgi:hypothetical protein
MTCCLLSSQTKASQQQATPTSIRFVLWHLLVLPWCDWTHCASKKKPTRVLSFYAFRQRYRMATVPPHDPSAPVDIYAQDSPRWSGDVVGKNGFTRVNRSENQALVSSSSTTNPTFFSGRYTSRKESAKAASVQVIVSTKRQPVAPAAATTEDGHHCENWQTNFSQPG